MFARHALLTSLALPLPCPWGRAQGTGGQHLQLHLSFSIFFSACMTHFSSLVWFPRLVAWCCLSQSNLAIGQNLAQYHLVLVPEMLATELIDCSSKVKTKQNDFPTVSREGWTSKIVFPTRASWTARCCLPSWDCSCAGLLPAPASFSRSWRT